MSALYQFSVVPFKTALTNLLNILNKAEEYAKEKGENVEDYLKLQIHPDMKDFTFQIQRCSDSAKFVLVRVAGTDSATVAMEDNEKTWADLKARLQKTIDVLGNANEKDFEGKEDITISLYNMNFTGQSYLQRFAIPNFYFHVTTAYDLLRMKGVPIGKMDFLMSPQ